MTTGKMDEACGSIGPNPKPTKYHENLLQTAVMMTEIGIELKERCALGDKYLTHLKVLFSQANCAILALQTTSKTSLQHAKRMIASCSVAHSNPDCDKLLALIDRQLEDFEEVRDVENECLRPAYVTEKIKLLEAKQKSDNNLPPSSSSKSVKSDIDEKYPENWSRDSSIDLSNVVNLPSVPEDVFSNFSSSKPKRSSSLSSLKSMRKVKLFLQRAETSDDEDVSSENEDQELCQKGDSDDGINVGKKHLGNIKEETQDNTLY